jgi:signal transduction histidine kinase
MIHGDYSPGFEGYFEGELAILQNQLCKLAATLKEKTDSLLKDKTYLSDSLADISHQIRTPLTSLNIISSMLAREYLPTAKRLELVKKTDLLLAHMDRLVTTLLKIAMIDSGTARLKRETVKVSRLIEKASQFVDLQMEVKHQKLIWTREERISFEGDPQWSAEALGNILKNCIQHTPEGGCIYVETLENPVFTEISIRDEGPGIPKKDLLRLFERFYKGSASLSGGFGIGLSLARMVAAAQNGTIKVANSKEGGAVFTIRFYKSTL